MHALLAAVDWHLLWRRTIGELTSPDGQFWRALWRTLYISVAAQLLGILLGLVAALMRMSKLGPMRWLSGLYVLIFRGTPVIVQIFFVYFGANLLFGVNLIRDTNFGAFTLSAAVIAGIVALGVNEGAYMREIIRAGIDSIDRGQMEAARSMGLSRVRTYGHVILPQAIRIVVPPLGNTFVGLLKGATIMAVIAVPDMVFLANELNVTLFTPFEVFAAVAVLLVVMVLFFSALVVALERRLKIG